MHFEFCHLRCFLLSVRFMLCVVRCKMCTNLHIAICVDVLPDFDFYYFQKTSAYEKSKPIEALAIPTPKHLPKKLAVMPVWALFGCWSRTTAWWRGGYMDFAFLHGLLPAKTSSAKFSHTTRLTCVNQCDSTPLNLQEPSSFFFEPRFVVLPLLLWRKAQSVEAIAAPWGS